MRKALWVLVLWLLMNVLPAAASIEVTIQPGPDDGNDSYTSQTYPDYSMGWKDYIFATTGMGIYYGFIQFREMDYYIEHGYELVSATMWLHLWDEINAGPPEGRELTTVNISPCDAAWHEMLITWNNQPGIVDEYTIAVEYEQIDSPGTRWQDFNITSIASAWFSQELPEYGLCLVAERLLASSSETRTVRPRLELVLESNGVEEASFGQIKAQYR